MYKPFFKITLSLLLFCCYFISNASVTATTTSTNSCNNNGTATMTASGGTAPYIYQWSNGANTPTISGLSPGSYYGTVVDNTGAKAYVEAFIGTNVTFTLNRVEETCPIGNNGEITVVMKQGTAPFTYLWSNGSNSPHLIGLTNDSIQNLTVTVTDANGCVSDPHGDTVIPFHPSFFYEFQDSGAYCPATTGSLSVYAYRGTAPYSYHWSNGSTASTITATVGVHYQVTVLDANGCKASKANWNNTGDTISIQSNFYVYCTGTDELCGNGAGALTTTLYGSGVAPYTYHWANGQNTTNLSGLHEGNYSLTVTDALGCSTIANGHVNNGSPININISSVDEQCGNGAGSLTAVANGGTLPYTFQWSNGANTQILTHLHEGNYYLTITDAHGCVSTSGIYLYNRSSISPNLTQQDEVCSNHAGWAKVSPTLGTAPYTYHWSSGSSSAQISDLVAGWYIVTITDAHGCTAQTYASIQNTSPIVPNGTYILSTCSNLNGSATVAPTGGTAPYTYLWNTTPPVSTTTASSLGVGSYSCLITDAHGCRNSYDVYLPYNSTLSVQVNNGYVICPNTNGTASVAVSGGTPPYQFHWSTGATSNTITNLATGGYSVTVNDANNCSVLKNAMVESFSPVQVNISSTNATCIFDANGTATASVSGGTAPYHYTWQNGQTTATSTGLNPMWYYGVYVTDAHGCPANNWTNIGYNNTNCAVDLCGYVIDDVNGNCVQESGEMGIPNVLVQTLPGGYTYTDAMGHYSSLQPPATFTLQQIIPNYFNQICPNPNPVINATVPDSQYCYNFYDKAIDTLDMRISWEFKTAARPGFSTEIDLYAFNQGIRAVNDTIVFDYDANMIFSSSSASPIFLNTTTHKVGFNTSTAGFGSLDMLKLYFDIPASTALGTLLTCTGKVGNVKLIAHDGTPLNNVETKVEEVVGSFDPNNKSVSPKGVGANGIIQRKDSILNYTIRFQNTGTFRAENVVITDTLDSDLEVTSIEGGASSHPYTLEFRGKNVLIFNFTGINLPDSNVNEAASHGMVSFYIKTKRNLPEGTQFLNKASIYFDYNKPVITSTTVNTLEKFLGIQELNTTNFSLYPNPTNDLITIETNFIGNDQAEVFDLMGRKMGKISIYPNTKNKVDVSKFADGIYFVKLKNQGVSKSFLKFKE